MISVSCAYLEFLIVSRLRHVLQIDELLKDEERAEIMSGHVDQLLLTLSIEFKMVYSTHMGDEETSKDDVLRLYRCLLGTLLAVSPFNHNSVRFLISSSKAVRIPPLDSSNNTLRCYHERVLPGSNKRIHVTPLEICKR